MRLWHIDLLPKLPRQQLLGQHRECCALRGAGWGKKHATVDYVFTHPYACLYRYHLAVMEEMHRRGYKAAAVWGIPVHRGQAVGDDWSKFTAGDGYRYPEHNAAYLADCVSNLAAKGISVDA